MMYSGSACSNALYFCSFLVVGSQTEGFHEIVYDFEAKRTGFCS